MRSTIPMVIWDIEPTSKRGIRLLDRVSYNYSQLPTGLFLPCGIFQTAATKNWVTFSTSVRNAFRRGWGCLSYLDFGNSCAELWQLPKPSKNTSTSITTYYPPALGLSCLLQGSSNQYLEDDCLALCRWSLNWLIGNLAAKHNKPSRRFASRTNNFMH